MSLHVEGKRVSTELHPEPQDGGGGGHPDPGPEIDVPASAWEAANKLAAGDAVIPGPVGGGGLGAPALCVRDASGDELCACTRADRCYLMLRHVLHCV